MPDAASLTSQRGDADTITATARGRGRDLRADIAASLVVFLVAVPLSLGIAVASGAPILAGLIAAVVGGVVAGFLGGSPLQVSGPAAGLTVVVAALVSEFGWQVTCFITVLAGLLQVVLSASRVARWALAISPVVVHAMLAGIGVTIVLQQLHVLLGDTARSSAWANLIALPTSLQQISAADAVVGLGVVAIMLGWKRTPARVRRVPGPLVAVVVVTIASIPLGDGVRRIALNGNIIDAIALPALPDGAWGSVALGVLTVALIASVESLLSAVAVDRMSSGRRTNLDRELFGQGAANVTSGMLGGLPVTGVIVRSATNVESGATSRASAILHGVWVLIFALLGVAALEEIPLAALAGLLVMIGIGLVKKQDVTLARRTGDLIVYVVTLLGVVFLNLLEGVAIGLALAVIILLWRVVRAGVDVRRVRDDLWTVSIHGSCSFLSLPRLDSQLALIPAGAGAIVEVDVDYLDHPTTAALQAWQAAHEAAGGTVTVREKGESRLAHSHDGRPSRTVRPGTDDSSQRWRDRQTEAAHAVLPHPLQQHHSLRHVFAGIDQFHRGRSGDLQRSLAPLAQSQDPDTLFITCADSRVVPNMITSSGPGDLFTVRNVGNLVPAPEDAEGDRSMEAALEFAVTTLGVTSLVVCGHSNCGAMKGLLSEQPVGGPVGSWLRHGDQAVSLWRLGHPVARQAAAAGYGEVDQLALVNVALQVQRLGRHPVVGQAAANGKLSIVGLFFDVGRARMLHVRATEIDDLAAADVEPGVSGS